jgi:uncharacterized damage-inducible protein DinB
MNRIPHAAVLAALLSLGCTGVLSAQMSGANKPMSHAKASMSHGNSVMDAVRSSLDRSDRIMVAAAEEMPAAKYSFKPTKQQRTFGEIVSHVANSNNFFCSKLSGMAAPTAKVPDGSAPKADLVAAVKASYAYCTKVLAGTTDAQLGTMVKYFGGRDVSRATVAVGAASDWADHYGQLAMYLRLNGMLPPTARRGGM